MTDPIERCDDCNHRHTPGPCDPNVNPDSGWRLYRATKTTTFKSASNEEERGNQ